MDLHFIQIAILLELAKHVSLNFSGFEISKDLEKDKFNYHLQTLVREKYILKERGVYSLTNKGKDIVSVYDFASHKKEKMPKVSILAKIYRTMNNKKQILVAKRLKQPYLNQLGVITGKVRYGEKFDLAMIRECEEETGLIPTKFEFEGVVRWIDFDKSTKELIHDAVFLSYEVLEFKGELIKISDESENIWVNLEDLKKHKELLPTIDLMSKGFKDVPKKIIYEEKEAFLSSF